MNGSALLSGIFATRHGGLKFPKFLDPVPKLPNKVIAPDISICCWNF
jgi:hypothetical protein